MLFLIIQFKTNAQHLQKYFTQKDGLSSYNLRSIVKDNNGFLWITTQDGLNKFDGYTFETFTKDKQDYRKHLDFTDCRSLYLDTTLNQLWVLGSEYGINVIDCNTNTIIKRFEIKLQNKNSFFVCFYKQNNFLWIGSSMGLYCFDVITKTSQYYPLIEHIKNELRINHIGADVFNNIWVAVNDYGIIILNNKSHKVICALNLHNLGCTQNSIKFSTLYFNKNLLTIGSEQNAITIQYDKNYNLIYNVASPLNQHSGIRGIFKMGNLIYECKDGLFTLGEKSSTLQKIFLQNNDTEDWLKSINTITAVKKNIIALGCNNGLLLINTNTPAIKPTINNKVFYNNNLSHLYSIEKYNHKELLLATETGLYIIRNDNSLIPIKTSSTYYNILKLENNLCIVSNKSGVKLAINYRLKSISNIYPEFKNYEAYQFNKIIILNKDTSILSTENEKGLLIWDKKNHTLTPITSTSIGLYVRSNTLNTIFKDSKNRIWALSDNTISLLNFNTKQTQILNYTDTKSKRSMGLFFDMVELSNKQYWINCYGNGIMILNDKLQFEKKISLQEGLSNNGLYKIFTYKNKVLTTSNNGITIIDKNTYKCTKLFAESDALHNNSFEEACGTIDKNIIYVGGINGYTNIDLEKITENNIAPDLFFTKTIINTKNKIFDTTNLYLQNLNIPNNATQTKISFVGLNYTNPTRVTYWYKIKQINNEWIPLGTQNFIDLIGLEPGKYELQVKAANEDGVECLPKMITLHFLPNWYQTLLFKILVALTIIGVLWLLYSFRIRQLKKIIAVRQKISSDLHDDIGSTLSSINMYSQVAQLQPNNPTHTAAIQENTRDVLEKLDDIVWATNPKNDQVKNLIERMDNFARPLLQANGIRFSFTPSPKIDTLTLQETTRQNLFLIFKEAINNTCKYAKANNCTLTLLAKNKTLHCTIADDGIGFDTTLPTHRNGLLNMQQRVAQLKGKIVLESTIGVGTTITIQLPI